MSETARFIGLSRAINVGIWEEGPVFFRELTHRNVTVSSCKSPPLPPPSLAPSVRYWPVLSPLDGHIAQDCTTLGEDTVRSQVRLFIVLARVPARFTPVVVVC